jgi:hypothetical protein
MTADRDFEVELEALHEAEETFGGIAAAALVNSSANQSSRSNLL